MRLQYITGDLFDTHNALGHCVSQDIIMGKGIAKTFKSKFGRVDEIKAQNKSVGETAVLLDIKSGRYIYYLITKKRYNQKPTYDTLKSSLQAMKGHIVDHAVENISIPKIGCGLDRLEWDKVLNIIYEVFVDVEIVVSVYSLP